MLRRSALNDAALNNANEIFPGETFIVRNCAYIGNHWILTPFKDNGRLSPNQKLFNQFVSQTRIIVERVFGLLKTRFRRIYFFTEYTDLNFVVDTIVADCILHNLCIDENDELEPDLLIMQEELLNLNDVDIILNDPNRNLNDQIFERMFNGNA